MKEQVIFTVPFQSKKNCTKLINEALVNGAKVKLAYWVKHSYCVKIKASQELFDRILDNLGWEMHPRLGLIAKHL